MFEAKYSKPARPVESNLTLLGLTPEPEQFFSWRVLDRPACAHRLTFNLLKAGPELSCGASQRFLGVDLEIARVVRQVEQDIAELLGSLLFAWRIVELLQLFGELDEDVTTLRPLEAHRRCLA